MNNATATNNPTLELRVTEKNVKKGKYFYEVLVDGVVLDTRSSDRVYAGVPIFVNKLVPTGETIGYEVVNQYIGRPDLFNRFKPKGAEILIDSQDRKYLSSFLGFATVQDNPTPDPGKTQDSGSLEEISGPDDHNTTPETEDKISQVTQAIAAGKKFKCNGDPIDEIYIDTLRKFTDDQVLVQFRNEGGLSRSVDINDIEIVDVPADKSAIPEDLKREYFKFDVKISNTVYGRTATWSNYKNPENLDAAPGETPLVTWFIYQYTDKQFLICRYFIGSGSPPTISSALLYDQIETSGNFEEDVYAFWLTDPEFRNPAPKTEGVI